MTVVQMDSELPVSQTIIDIAKRIMVPVEEQKEGAV
jgi:nitrogenase iron protein NifH